jgi:hypothetical protein
MSAAPDSKEGHMFCDSCWHKQFPQIKSSSIFHTEVAKPLSTDEILSENMVLSCSLSLCIYKKILLIFLKYIESVNNIFNKNIWGQVI